MGSAGGWLGLAQVISHCLLTLADPTPTLEGLCSVILEEKSSFSLQVWQGWRGHVSCGQELSSFPACPRCAEVVDCWDRRLLETPSGCRDLSVALALPSFTVATSSERSHIWSWLLPEADCSPAHSGAVLAVLPPHLKSSNWLFGSLYTKFKLLALTS